MEKVFSITLLLFLSTTVLANTLTVKQDGTGDYTTIQEAVNAAIPYDTVLVYPGTYYENIIIENKGLWLASLSLTTGDSSYRNTTIIDGNQNGACVAMLTTELNTNDILHGFTVQNGSGRVEGYADWTRGGGVYVGESINAFIENCIIKNNNATKGGGGIHVYWNSVCNVTNCIITNNRSETHGGGIDCLMNNTLFLSITSIFNNHAFGVGGGVTVGYHAICYFDSINLCSIYNNYASWAADIHNGTQETMNIYVDTLTVMEPDWYFVSSIDDWGYQNNDYTISIQNSYLTPIDSDLYVNPLGGSDQNRGLSPDSALKTIAFAYSKIDVDSICPNTIHLANGVYSDTVSGEKFPLNIRPFVNIEGESMSGTILDGEHKTFLLKGNNEISNYKLSKMTVQRGNHVNYDDHFAEEQSLAWLYLQGDNITLDSMLFQEGWSMCGYENVSFGGGNNSRISNSMFKNNLGGIALLIGAEYEGDTSYVSNCIFEGHRSDTNHPDPMRHCASALSNYGANSGIAIVTNSLFIDNEQQSYVSLFGDFNSNEVQNNYFVNCTFTTNSIQIGFNSMWMDATHNYFYNCIMYNNGIGQGTIWLSDSENLGKTHLEIYNSLIEYGEDAIQIFDETPTYYYDHHTNIDADPNFLGLWDHPYQIADGSPCINTGTLANLPDFIVLPETDLAGNPRIVGDSIDMGCYEWNPTIVGFNEIGPGSENDKPKLLTAAPNPFATSTTIGIKYKSEENVKVEIYDSFGNRVKTLLSSSFAEGNKELPWDGTNNNGKLLPSGTYFAIMFYGEKEVESLKVIKR